MIHRSLWLAIGLSLCVVTTQVVATDVDDDEKQHVDSSAVVKVWCKKKSAYYFKERNITPYNWTASWWDEGRSIVVQGEWRVEDTTAQVSCRAERGSTLKHAVMTIELEARP